MCQHSIHSSLTHLGRNTMTHNTNYGYYNFLSKNVVKLPIDKHIT